MEEEKQILITSYLKDFVCIGSECDDTCCQGFKRILVDQSSYERYRALDLSGSPFPIVDHLDIVQPDDLTHYSEIRSTEDNRCPFLDEQQLCKIQKTFGSEALSYTCASFPRIFNLVGNYVQLSGTLSCPEICRLALLPQDKISFELYPAREARFSGLCTQEIPISTIENPSSPYAHFDNLQLQAIQILQDRNFTPENRCILLLMWAHKVQEYCDTNQLSQIPQLQEEFEHFRFSDGVHGALRNFQGTPDAQLQLIAALVNAGFTHPSLNQRFRNCYSQFSRGLSFNPLAPGDSSERLQEAYLSSYLSFFIDNQHILENFLVNTAVTNLLPFSQDENIYDTVVLFLLRFCVLRTLIMGMALETFGANIESDFLRLAQSYFKAFEGNEILIKEELTRRKQSQEISLFHIAGLLLN